MKTRLGHYDIVAELGRGGMGVVYKGHESSLNRYVAIKVLADSLAHDEGVKERFLREARSMASLNDPHIIQIYYIGEDEGQTYFVMEFVEGESLGTLLKREHKVPVGAAAKIIYQTALGLATAHDKGVIHRDIKPGNLMLSSRGSIKIADFGIALSNQDMSKKLTSTGEFVGTPGYLSPEVCLGKQVDQRSDIFSLGIVLFEMLAGRMPFTDESPLGLMLEVVRAEIPDVRQLNGEVDEQIAWILSKMIAKEPIDRYQSCHELAADLANHPLVAISGPITLVPVVSSAAATMVGQKTPLSGPRPIASSPAMADTRVTPSAQPMPPAVGAPTAISVPAEAPAFERRSVLERSAEPTQRSKSGVLPIAIAAGLLLALVGGAWALRDHIPGFSGNKDAERVASTEARPSVEPASLAASKAAGSSAAASSTIASSESSQAAVVTEDSGSNSADRAASTAATTHSDAANAQATASQVVESSQHVAQVATDQDSSADGPGPRASQADVEALRDLPAARAAQSGTTELAVATPPKKQTPPTAPRVPTIALVVTGDDVIADPAADAMVSLLQNRGFRVIESSGSGGPPSVRSFAGKADGVVFVNAKPIGSQQLNYYGQSSTLYTVQMVVRAYRVADGSTVWTSSPEQVNFTTLNASEKAREVIEPLLDDMDRNLDEFRARRRG